EDQGFQVAQYRRRLLAGRRKKSTAAAYLRHLVFFPERSRSISAPGGRGQKTRSSCAWQTARFVLYSRTRRSGLNLLAPQGWGDPQADGRLDAGAVPETGLLAGVHPARRPAAAVANLRTRRLLRGQHVRSHGARRRRISP